MLRNRLLNILGLSGLSKEERGVAYVSLVAFVPLIYKLIVPFFVILGIGKYTFVINGTILTIGLVLARKLFINNIKFVDVVTYFFIATFLLIASFLYPKTSDFVYDNYVPFIFQVVPFYFLGLSLITKNREQILLFVARAGIVVQFFWQLCFLIGIVAKEGPAYDDSLGEQMSIAYSLLFPIYILFDELVKRKSIINIVFLFVGISLLLFMGTRGPIVILAVFLIGYFIIINRFEHHNLVKKITIISIFLLLYVFLVPICLFLIPLVSSLGFSTRVFNSIVEQTMVNMEASSSRDDFYDRVFNAICNNDGFGYGWGGDRLFTPDGAYAHNFELEILCQFGFVLGGFILLVISLLLIKAFSRCVLQQDRNFLFIMFCTGFLTLQFSDSYIKSPLFFIFLGTLIGFKRKLYRKNN